MINSLPMPSWRSRAAGWSISLAVHGLLLILAMATLRGCQKSGSGQPGGETFRTVGLFVVDGADEGRSDDGAAAGAGSDPSTRDGSQASKVSSEAASPAETTGASDRVPNQVPDVRSLLDSRADPSSGGRSDISPKLPDLIGSGIPIGGLESPQGGGGSTADRMTAGGRARVGGVGGQGETTFMNITGVGETVVYVIDISSSMDGSRLKLAQRQLKASLRLLQPTQKFAVLFYNEQAQFMRLRGRGDRQLFAADELTRSVALQEIDRVLADNGTQHKPALLMALGIHPDVVYFLTDGDEPALYPQDLREIAQAAGAATIHVIRFGEESRTPGGARWMQQLAEQSGGEYREIDPR